MKKGKLAIAVCLAVLLSGCGREVQLPVDPAKDKPIVVGFSQVGAESEWRVANTESVKAALSEENGYDLIFEDARQEQENQIRAIRTFIQQDVDYIVFSPKVTTGWKTVLQEAREAGIPVIMIDRDIEEQDRGLVTAFVGSDFRNEGEKAVRWLESLLEMQGRESDPVRIVHIQGTMGSAAQIGRTAALEQAVQQHANWEMAAQECGDFTRAKAYEVMTAILKQTKDIDVVYCENDGEALGAIDAMEEAGLKCSAADGVIVISFDATKLALQYCLEGKIGLDVECNPLQGPYIDEIIRQLERGEPIEQVKYIEETQFDCFTITREMIDSRNY
ncbi:MAG: substrate-binding domain-containing protein [Clostridiaceae bacterium]|jgi:simple sugar transport system substrate-binding protein|nr:substrate-binding domain-containing protein [Clostridiaceae bacterium]